MGHPKRVGHNVGIKAKKPVFVGRWKGNESNQEQPKSRGSDSIKVGPSKGDGVEGDGAETGRACNNKPPEGGEVKVVTSEFNANTQGK